jgi:hypothetical protein
MDRWQRHGRFVKARNGKRPARPGDVVDRSDGAHRRAEVRRVKHSLAREVGISDEQLPAGLWTTWG